MKRSFNLEVFFVCDADPMLKESAVLPEMKVVGSYSALLHKSLIFLCSSLLVINPLSHTVFL